MPFPKLEMNLETNFQFPNIPRNFFKKTLHNRLCKFAQFFVLNFCGSEDMIRMYLSIYSNIAENVTDFEFEEGFLKNTKVKKNRRSQERKIIIFPIKIIYQVRKNIFW